MNEATTMTRLPWRRIVDLATQLESTFSSNGQLDIEMALRLARAVLQFQEQLLGGLVKAARVP
jgi:hypothetical protein